MCGILHQNPVILEAPIVGRVLSGADAPMEIGTSPTKAIFLGRFPTTYSVGFMLAAQQG